MAVTACLILRLSLVDLLSDGAGTLKCWILRVQATIVKRQLSRMESAPRREGVGCQPTSFSSSWEAEATAMIGKAKNRKIDIGSSRTRAIVDGRRILEATGRRSVARMRIASCLTRFSS
jgi:hypothetical protein